MKDQKGLMNFREEIRWKFNKNACCVPQVEVIVSEENKFAPLFEEQSYTLWAFRYWPPGTVAGRVTAKDADTQPYNRQITYSMTTTSGNAQVSPCH